MEGNNSKENKEQSGLAVPSGTVVFLNWAAKATLMMAASRSSNR